MERIVTMLDANLKDDLVKEEFLSRTGNITIVFKFNAIQPNSSNGTGYHAFGFDNGNFIVSMVANFDYNWGDIDYFKLEKML
jgi:hypothetical protein